MYIMNFIWVMIALLLVTSGASTECQPGQFGQDCKGECHCWNRVCHVTNGSCVSGQCSPGWRNAPLCQTGCEPGRFGPQCAYQCKCPSMDTCNAVHGLCSSGSCLHGWAGPGCQTELPVLLSGPGVFHLEEKGSFAVKWNAWVRGRDAGSVQEVHAYMLQYQLSGSNHWVTSATLENSHTGQYTHVVHGLPQGTEVSFRVVLVYTEDNKAKVSIPGKASQPIKISCEVPSLPPTQLKVRGRVTTAPSPEVDIMVNWQPPVDLATKCQDEMKYIIAVNCSGGCSGRQFDAEGNETSVGFSMQTSKDDLSLGTLTVAVVRKLDGKSRNSLPVSLTNIFNTAIETNIFTTQSTVSSENSVSDLAPTGVHLEGRSETSLKLVWTVPMSALHPIAHQIDCYIVRSYGRLTDFVIPHRHHKQVLSPSVTLNNLQMASYYKIVIKIVYSNLLVSDAKEVFYWTEIGQPPAPKAMIPLHMSNHSVTMELHPPVDIHTGPLSCYQIVVHVQIEEPEHVPSSNSSLQSRNHARYPREEGQVVYQNLSLGDFYHVAKNESNMYITAELEAHTSSRAITFEIGDGKNYGGYFNAPLKSGRSYYFYFGVVSRLDGITKTSFSRTKRSVRITNHEVITSGSSHGSNKAAVIVPVLLLLLLIILTVIVLYVVWQHRRKKQRAERYHDILDHHLKHASLLKNYTYGSHGTPDDLEDTTLGGKCIDYSPEIYQTRNEQHRNVISKKSNPIIVEHLLQHVGHMEASDYNLAEEFKHLPPGNLFPADVAKLPVNVCMNRSSKVLPYDKNRVCLTRYSGEHSDYINASYISGYPETKIFVVTQTPVLATQGRFWRLVVDKGISKIVMLGNLSGSDQEESDKYWIDGGTGIYDDIQVTCLSEQQCAYFTTRVFQVSRFGSEQARNVSHYQFHSWSQGIPAQVLPFLDFVRKILEDNQDDTCLVHCHTGAGRSGLYIAVESLLQQGKETGTVDVLKMATRLCFDRTHLIQTARQYKFIYACLIEMFCTHSLQMSKEETDYECMDKIYQQILVDDLENVNCSLDNTMESLINSPSKRTPSRSRFVSPMGTPSRVFIRAMKKYKLEDGGEPSLFVTLADTYRQRDAFVLLREPTDEQWATFWGLVYHSRASAVINLSVSKSEENILGLPVAGAAEAYEAMYVENVHEDSKSPTVIVRKLRLQQEDLTEVHSLKHFHSTGWPGSGQHPNHVDVMALVDAFAGWYYHHSSLKGPVIVCCEDGSTNSGLFCTLWLLLETMEEEGRVDFHHTLKSIKRSSDGKIPRGDQYSYCYEFLRQYLRRQHVHVDDVVYDAYKPGPTVDSSICRELSFENSFQTFV